jgi:hypothetical protein
MLLLRGQRMQPMPAINGLFGRRQESDSAGEGIVGVAPKYPRSNHGIN